MGFDKLFAVIAGEPVIAHAIRAFERATSISEIVVVAREQWHDEIRKIASGAGFKKIRAIVPGGERRQDSVRAGLGRIDRDAKYVAVHDAARPLITPEQIERAFEQCRVHGAAALAQPVNDTLKRADADLLVVGSVDRHQLYAMQTPQIFERKLIEDAYQRCLCGKHFRNRRSLSGRATRPQNRSSSSTMTLISKSLTRAICRLQTLFSESERKIVGRAGSPLHAVHISRHGAHSSDAPYR